MQVLESQSNLIEVEQTLSKNAYFSRSPLPGFADAVIFNFLAQNKKYPEKKVYPNFYHWYIIMKQFSESSFEGWIREKRYVDNQSEKCIMLISEIFKNQSRHVLQQSNRKKSFDNSHIDYKRDKSLIESAKCQPVGINFHPSIIHKAEYSMIVQLRSVQNLEELFNKFYKFKMKIKQLKFNKKQKSIFLKFVAETDSFETIEQQINEWNEVRHVISKMTKSLKQTDQKKKIMRTVSIR